jgi:hypothetical protein
VNLISLQQGIFFQPSFFLKNRRFLDKKNNPHLKITKIAEGVRSEAPKKSNFLGIFTGIVAAQRVSYDSCRRPRGGFLCGGRRIENKKTFLPRRASKEALRRDPSYRRGFS